MNPRLGILGVTPARGYANEIERDRFIVRKMHACIAVVILLRGVIGG